MPAQPPIITAWRYVHGKAVTESGGAVAPGFEQRSTSISQGMPAGLLPLCRPMQLFGDRLTAELIHPQCEHEGALFFWPACCEDRRYMLATCVRARPESGDGGLSRRYAQLATFVFTESDWNQWAPRLIANAGRWLRAEPDTLAFHEQHRDTGDYPAVRLDADDLPVIPPCDSGALPKPGNLVWRLTTAIESADENLLCGAADGIDSVSTFLRTLAHAAALLPRSLRIYLTAAAGFAEAQKPFAIQYLPQAPALASTAPGLLAPLAGDLMDKEPKPLDQGRWQQRWQPAGDTKYDRITADLADPAGWQTAAQARLCFARVCDDRIAHQSAVYLDAWLSAKQPNAPKRPALHHHKTGKLWLLKLTRRLNDGLHGPAASGLARALSQLATLIDTDGTAPAQERQQASFWARAWREAAAPLGDSARLVLRWSALSGSRLADDPADAQPRDIGYLRDFSELRAVIQAMQRARTEPPPDAALVNQAIGNPAFKDRLEQLRRRADWILIRRPLAIIDLAESLPQFLLARPGDAPADTKALAETLRTLLIAANLYDWSRAPVPTGQRGLVAAAQRVVAQSLKIDVGDKPLWGDFAAHHEDYLGALLRCYWQWALAADGDTDCLLWRDGVVLALYLWTRQAGLSEPLRCLFQTCGQDDEEAVDRPPDQTKLMAAAADLFSVCMQTIAPLDRDPAKVAAGLFGALPDLRQLAPGADHRVLTDQMSKALYGQILQILTDPRTPAETLITEFIPVFNDRLGNLDAGIGLAPELARRLLIMALGLLNRLLECGPPLPREPVTGLFDQLERIILGAPGGAQDFSSEIDALAGAVAGCILAWADADPPEPWFHPDWFAADAKTSLINAPIRLRLAQRLGFPRCAYFAALTPGNDTTATTNKIPEPARVPPAVSFVRGMMSRDRQPPLELLPAGLDEALASLKVAVPKPRSLDIVIAYGAARTWRTLFDQGGHKHNDVKRLLGEPVTGEALEAIVRLVNGTKPTDPPPIDEDAWFVVSFLASLGMNSALIGRWPLPDSLREVLLYDSSAYDTNYALQLGRMLAIRGSWLASPLINLFDHSQCNSMVAKRILLLSNDGWDEFAQQSEADRQYALLRLLFLLELIIAADSAAPSRGARVGIPEERIKKALQFFPENPGTKDQVAQFFDRNPHFASAFQAAQKAAGIDRLPGWPDALKPLRKA